jgi:hypothetical protein
VSLVAQTEGLLQMFLGASEVKEQQRKMQAKDE